MSFQISLTGLNAAQTEISTTSHNIANSSTLGFHGSRAEFSDIFMKNPYAKMGSIVGSGTQTSRISRDFSLGALSATGNVLDMSIQGPGFFQVQDTGDKSGHFYTRAGAFNMDNEGYIVSADGYKLTAFPTAEDGSVVTTTKTQALQVPKTYGVPRASETVQLAVNASLKQGGGMGSQAAVPAAPFDPANTETFAYSTPVPMFDDNGNAIEATAYLVADTLPTAADPAISYQLKMVVDGRIATPDTPGQAMLAFDRNRLQVEPTAPVGFSIGATQFSLDMTGSQVSEGDFAALSVAHDGTRASALTAVEVSADGVVWASYGDEVIATGQVAIAMFPDLQGLVNEGKSLYSPSRASGEVQLGSSTETGFAQIRSGSLEKSNVEMTEELVNLIMAQRNYQANAKALETSSSLSQTIVNIRG